MRPLLALALALLAGTAHAAPKDAQAKKALNDAMEVDYLNTDFDKAEQKLRTAIDACGADGCTPALKSKLYVALGSVLAGGKKQLDDAKDAFIEALRLDKSAALDPDVASTEITYAFEKAKAEAKGGGAPPPSRPPTDLQHTPPTEQKIGTPVPLFVELPADLIAKMKRVTVAYRAPGKSEWRTLVLKKIGESGFGINVPCDDLKAEGTLKYAITVEGDGGEVLASAGSRASPLSTEMKPKIDGEPPHWPGFAPPATCGKVDAGPKQCVDDHQCNADLVCIGGECVSKPSAGGSPGVRKNWVSVAFSPDVSLVSGSDVCTADSQANGHFACFREDGSRYQGTPTTKGDKIGDNVNLGPAIATLRLVVGYDRLLLDNLTVGVRVGFAFNGAPTGADFLPLHAELRGAYWLGKDPFATTGARPYLFASGGVAQIDTKVNVQVLEDGEVCGAEDSKSRSSKCTKSSVDGRIERRIQDLTAYRQAGYGFVGVGVGFSYAPMPLVAFNVAVRGSVTIPVVTAVLSPEAGVSLGF